MEAAALPGCLRVPRRCSGGGGGFTCKLHVAAHAACQASQSDSCSLPPLRATTLWQRCSLRLTCQAASLTDLQAAAARALFKPRGVGDIEARLQLDNTTICLVRRVALSYQLHSYHSWRSAWHASSPSAPLQHDNSHDCPARVEPAPLGNLQSLQLHDHTATLVRSVRVI